MSHTYIVSAPKSANEDYLQKNIRALEVQSLSLAPELPRIYLVFIYLCFDQISEAFESAFLYLQILQTPNDKRSIFSTFLYSFAKHSELPIVNDTDFIAFAFCLFAEKDKRTRKKNHCRPRTENAKEKWTKIKYICLNSICSPFIVQRWIVHFIDIHYYEHVLRFI